SNATIISKVYFPRMILPITSALSSAIDFGIAFAVLIGLMLVYGMIPQWTIIFVPVIVLLAGAAAGGGVPLRAAPHAPHPRVRGGGAAKRLLPRRRVCAAVRNADGHVPDPGHLSGVVRARAFRLALPLHPRRDAAQRHALGGAGQRAARAARLADPCCLHRHL